jgi:hypothetical protein
MSIHTFQLGGYSILLSGTVLMLLGDQEIKAVGSILCEGEDDVDAYRVRVYFLADGSPELAPTISDSGHEARLCLPRQMMPIWIDLLRYEKPLYGYINTSRPTSTHIRTSATEQEPIGEGEGLT